jgi:hypothetical protein
MRWGALFLKKTRKEGTYTSHVELSETKETHKLARRNIRKSEKKVLWGKEECGRADLYSLPELGSS